MNELALKKLQKARSVLIMDQPFFGTLALRLLLQENTAIPTLCVDGKTVFYNPDFVMDLSDAVTCSAMAHETMHCVLNHVGRLHGREPKRWNIAADFALNLLLYDARFEIPTTWLMDNQYRDMSADQIYALLPDDPDDNAFDEIIPGPGASSPAEQAEQAREWVVATVQAANAALAAGHLPGGMERFVDTLTHPKVDWKTVLHRFITETTKDDYSWVRPNKRMIVHGVYLPSLYSNTIGDIVIGVDTSCSIGRNILTAFASEIDAITAEVRPSRIHVMYCDYNVNHVDVFERGEEFTMHPVGGGGTRFSPVFDEVEQRNIRPACMIYLTDLEGDTGFKEPDYPTLWCCTTKLVAPWGETIHVTV